MTGVRGDGAPTRSQRAEAHLRVAIGASQRADELDALARAVRAGHIDPSSAQTEALTATATVLRLVSGAATMELAALTAPEPATPPTTLWARLRWLLFG